MDDQLQGRLRAIGPTPEGLYERGLLLARGGHAEEAGECVLELLEGGECPLALLDALAPPELSSFETRVIGKRFERPRLGDLAFGPKAERLYCVQDRVQLMSLDLTRGTWEELGRTQDPIRSLGCDRAPILTYDSGLHAQPVVRLEGQRLVPVPSPKSHGGRELIAGLLPGAYLIRGPRSLKAYDLAAKKRTVWSLSGGFGDDVVGVGPGGAVALREGQLCFFEFGARQPQLQIEVGARHCPDSAHFGSGGPFRTFAIQRAGAGAQILYQLNEQDHAHGLSWIGLDGQLEGLARLPFGAWRWAASPSGRYALVLTQERGRAGPNRSRTRQVFLVDLIRGEVRELSLPALPGGLAWSRSGRSFAISTEEGTLFLGQADPTLAAAAAKSTGLANEEQESASWRELYKAERFWRARQVETRVEFQYGALGAAGIRRSKSFTSAEQAAADLAKRLRRKDKEGYVER